MPLQVEQELVQSFAEYLNELCRIRLDLRSRAPVRLWSDTLLGAAYAALADSLVPGAGAAVRCAGCGGWFVRDVAHRKHCRDSCKTRACRTRKRLRERGVEENNGKGS